ncbi:FMN-dependent NADH-azoreductase [Actinophytocola sp.]|uniref:FMN-dependent NADH-azoreductase n=1 Tax=Actinophytocola sp. TaxID=1872138 RepID=UPI002D5A9202|nr:NAD(P)H-dependent oxidoreductase [Actinophytocola sp.]HYQ65533.1 NAD(P)H-dependent oxidoreductase [Actinophytocola sp.]
MMSTLLHLDASARPGSFSRGLSARFAAVWRAVHPDGRYLYRDLAADPVPFVTEGWTSLCDAVLAAGITDGFGEVVTTSAQREAWAVVEPLLAELTAADTVLIGTPMYNFSVPAALKAWLDQVTFPRMSLRGRRFVVAGARGGTYRPGTPRAPFDHEERYLRDFFAGHFDVEDVVFVHAELTNALVDPRLADRLDAHEASLAAALERLAELAR